MRRLFLHLILLFLPLSLAAQTAHYEGNIFVGGKAGLSMARTFFNPSVPQKMAMGATAGFTFRYIEENHFGLIAELNWEQRGWEESFKSGPFKYHRTLNYLQLPVLAHIYFGSPRAHFYLNAGPEIGVMVAESTSANFDYHNIDRISDFPKEGRRTAQMTIPAKKGLDFGISAGLGAEYFVNSRNSITLEARFYYGLGNVIKSGRAEDFSSANSMGLMVTMGYWFRCK